MHKPCKSKVRWYNFLVKIFQKSSANFIEKYDSAYKNEKTPGTESMENSINAINKRIGLPPIGKDGKNVYRYMR